MICLALIYHIQKLDLDYHFLRSLGGEIHFIYLILAVFLVLPNYYFEIKKWEILGSQIEKRNFTEATRDVLRGLKLGVFTPLMIGDFVGRSLDFKKENRGTAMALNLFNSIAQTWVSLFMGGIALVFWWFIADNHLKSILLFPSLIINIASMVGLALIYGLKIKFLSQLKWIKKYIPEFELDQKVKTRILWLTTLRNLVYLIQYIFFYLAFTIVLTPLIYFIGVNILLLIKTVGGGLNILGDLGIRELISLQFFSRFDIDPRLILVATFVVWVVNVFFPILFGIFIRPQK